MAAAIALSAVVVSMTAGCDVQNCDDVQRQYERTVERETGLEELTDQGAPHLAMAMRLDLVNDLTSGLIDAAVGEALGHRGNLDIGAGQTVRYSVGSTGADLRFRASDACTTCLRVSGSIKGDAEVDLPLVGVQSSPLSGSMDWTVPLAVARNGDEVAIFLDTEEALRMGAPRLQGQLNALDNQWATAVANELLPILADAVAREVPPLRLVGYEMPELGLNGLDITPSLFAFDGSSNSVILGIRTNLPVQTARGSDQDFIGALSLADGQNIALAVQPGLAVEAVRHAFRTRNLDRRYNLNGEARRDGQLYAVVDSLNVGGGRGNSDAVNLGLDFRLFNFRSQLACYTMGGLVSSTLQISNGRMRLNVDDVEFTGGGALVEAANWGSARFVQQSHEIINRSLDDDLVVTSDMGLSLQANRLSTQSGMLVLGGQGSAN